ncbi:SNF2-related protein [Massilia sp. LjRoot122]|uniref:SNF2-related protein n=1 Tax=Massilia sp. LjRoot122 TaxID=3342257 RepID=UPI003ECDB2AC
MQQQDDWYAPLRNLVSLGSRKSIKIENMGMLAAARREHLGQFFTPDFVARWMWSFIADLPIHSVLDNSIGSGRLLQFADPTKHMLLGVDVHQQTVDEVKRVVSEAGFKCDIICAGMETVRPKGVCASLINPPFSVHLESAGLEPEQGFTRMGRFGPDSSATSDEYAVVQALKASRVVLALLPRSSADAIRAGTGCWQSNKVQSRLRAVFDLPANTFREENANVHTSVVIFGEVASKRPPLHQVVESFDDPVPVLDLLDYEKTASREPKLRYQLLDAAEPTITLPVTGDQTVRISLDGRKVKLRYFCGLTQAMVANAVLKRRIFSTEHHRLPSGVRFDGEGKLDVEVYLMQSDPVASFNKFVDSIREAGGEPCVQRGVIEAIQRKHRRNQRGTMPLRHTVWTRGAANMSCVRGIAKKTHNVDPKLWVSPVIQEGEQIEFKRVESGKYSYEKKGRDYVISADDLEAKFTLEGASAGWQVVHEGLAQAYPAEAARLRSRALKLGIEKWLSWDFQLDDLIEMTMKPWGGTAAWQMACGKSRLGVALIRLSGVKHGLIVVESRLIDEMVGQLRRIGIGAEDVCVIDAPAKLSQLKQINLIAYERLRMLVDESVSKNTTYAKALRRRIGLVAADEGERLANFDSDQSRALFQLSARKRYILTGTPVANYPRDIHGLLLFTAGDGTAAQPYGYRRQFLEAWQVDTMQYATRGIEKIRNDFVVIEWCTHEFSETLREGAKREIPKIANVEKYRAWLAPHVKRRLTAEPDVAKYITLPPAKFETIEVEWDSQHLAYYLKAADDFAEIYRRARDSDEKNNLALLLAKLQAVQKALNIPQAGVEGLGVYPGLTSKQRAVVEYMVNLSARGKKALLYCENPATVKLLFAELAARGIKAVQFHGGISIKRRVKAKDDEFIRGSADHLLATKASARAGYNIPEADYVLFYDRSWSAKTEGQAMHRPMRVERKEPVTVVYFHLPGSLDHYQDQMVKFKADSAQAGLDWATPELEDAEFLHLSTVLQNFVDDLGKIHNMTPRAMRAMLKAA